MFVEIMIIVIVLTEFITILNARERFLVYDGYTVAGQNRDKNSTVVMSPMHSISLIFRLIISIFILFFWIYAIFFAPYLLWSIVINSAVMIFTYFMLRKAYSIQDYEKQLRIKSRILRVDSILTILIWLPHLISILSNIS